MTGRERLLTAIDNGKPDHLPCQVHGWMGYYLSKYLGGIDQYEAYKRFGMDMAIYAGPEMKYSEKDLANWQVQHVDRKTNEDGATSWREIITTPSGQLTSAHGSNPITTWTTEPLVKTKEDFEAFIRHIPTPIGVDGALVRLARERVGDRGIVRGVIWCYGQMGAWQSFCTLVGTEEAIMFAVDEPDWVHYVEESLLAQHLRYIEMMPGEVPYDLVELGGGGGSNTVISPKMHAEFCVPYDKQQVDALHAGGYKTVYHLCGGLMHMLDNVIANGSDGLETMTPPSLGGDCDLAEANRRVGDKLFFVGGFDQGMGFERGTPEGVRKQVLDLFAACPDGGYICSPSDHFFSGDPANLQAFADACRECAY